MIRRVLALVLGLAASCVTRPAFAATTGQVGVQPVGLKASAIGSGTDLSDSVFRSRMVYLTSTLSGGVQALAVYLPTAPSVALSSSSFNIAQIGGVAITSTGLTVSILGNPAMNIAQVGGVAVSSTSLTFSLLGTAAVNFAQIGGVTLSSTALTVTIGYAPIVFSTSPVGERFGYVGPMSGTTTGTVVDCRFCEELTYQINQTGVLSGATLFTDVSNADTPPASTSAREWKTLTPNGIITSAPGAGLLGQVGADVFYMKGYRWIKWRIESQIYSNLTVEVHWRAKVK